MRNVLTGGILVTTHPTGRVPTRTVHDRRRRHVRARRTRGGAQPVPPVFRSTVQPGQLTSPLLNGGFPSLSLH